MLLLLGAERAGSRLCQTSCEGGPGLRCGRVAATAGQRRQRSDRSGTADVHVSSLLRHEVVHLLRVRRVLVLVLVRVGVVLGEALGAQVRAHHRRTVRRQVQRGGVETGAGVGSCSRADGRAHGRIVRAARVGLCACTRGRRVRVRVLLGRHLLHVVLRTRGDIATHGGERLAVTTLVGTALLHLRLLLLLVLRRVLLISNLGSGHGADRSAGGVRREAEGVISGAAMRRRRAQHLRLRSGHVTRGRVVAALPHAGSVLEANTVARVGAAGQWRRWLTMVHRLLLLLLTRRNRLLAILRWLLLLLLIAISLLLLRRLLLHVMLLRLRLLLMHHRLMRLRLEMCLLLQWLGVLLHVSRLMLLMRRLLLVQLLLLMLLVLLLLSEVALIVERQPRHVVLRRLRSHARQECVVGALELRHRILLLDPPGRGGRVLLVQR